MLSGNHIKIFVLLWTVTFLSSACETDGFLLDDTSIEGIQYSDAVGFEMVTVKTDSVNTTNQSRLLVGRYEDDNFGILQATTYSSLISLFDSVVIAPEGVSTDSIAYDSAVVVLQYDYLYGERNTGKPQRLIVSELAEAVDTSSTKEYYAFDKLPIARTLADTSIVVSDSSSRYSITLGEDFGKNLYDRALEGRINKFDAVSQFTKGIALSTDGDTETMFGFAPVSGNNLLSTIEIRYHYYLNGDTISQSFPLLFDKRFHHLEQNLTGTPLENLSVTNPLPSSANGNVAYVQPGTGIATFVKFDSSELGKLSIERDVVINSAKFYIGRPVSGTGTENIPAPTILQLVHANQDRGFGFLEGTEFFDVLDSDLGGLAETEYNTRAMEYPSPFLITNYVEAVANNTSPNHGFFITGQVLNAQGNNFSASSVNGLVIGNRDYTGNEAFPTQLRIFYVNFQ